jgi:hypothetical protein
VVAGDLAVVELTRESLRERLAALPPARRRAIAEAGRRLVDREQLRSESIPFSFHILPLVLDAGEVQRALASCEAVIRGLIRLEQHALGPDGEDLRDRLLAAIGPAGRRLFDMCTFESTYSLERRFRRFDAMLEDGACRTLEVNQAAPAFLHFHDALQRIAAEVLAMIGIEHRPALLAPRVAAWLVGEYRHRSGITSAPELVAVVSEQGYPFKQLELPAFTAACERAARELGCDTAFRLCYPHELALRGGRAWLGEARVDMIWRNSALLDTYARQEEIADYVRICQRHDEHLIVNSTRVWLTLTKDALSLLSSDAVLARLGLSAEIRARLGQAIPRTVSLARDPQHAEEIAGAREEWISKPAAGSFSRGFEPGHWHGDESWRALVRERTHPEFVFQRLVRPQARDLLDIDGSGELREHRVRHDFCPHHVDGVFPGTALVRARIEGEPGGRIVPVAVV